MCYAFRINSTSFSSFFCGIFCPLSVLKRIGRLSTTDSSFSNSSGIRPASMRARSKNLYQSSEPFLIYRYREVVPCVALLRSRSAPFCHYKRKKVKNDSRKTSVFKCPLACEDHSDFWICFVAGDYGFKIPFRAAGLNYC